MAEMANVPNVPNVPSSSLKKKFIYKKYNILYYAYIGDGNYERKNF